ncbi:DUF58 domain-containing protein [Ilumatobacter sp.]|uniref:DUF58 domain-containing protein n=1 Tax=Ilumatobacter sp. TaxID=1967498 RepID=UPI003B52F092
MLTRSGLGATLASIVLAGLGVWWGYEEVVLVAIGTALIVMFALLVSQRPLRATVERRVRAIRVPRGDPVLIDYRIRNDTSHRSGWATILDRCDSELVEVTIPPVDAGSVSTVGGSIDTHHRGVFPLGPLDVSKIDPFHLAVGRWRDDRDTAAVTSVTVHPRVYQLVSPAGSSRVIENESIVRRAATDPMSGFVSMREYVPGDDPRLVHWPTTARTGTLMVREHVEVRRPEFTVVVDTGADAADEDDFEEIVDVAATLAVHALRTGLDVVVRTTDRRRAGRPAPLRSEAEVLDLLTPVARSVAEPPLGIAELFRHGLDNTSVLLVTGPTGPTSRISTDDRLVVVRIGDGAVAGTDATLAASDAAEFAVRWRSWT